MQIFLDINFTCSLTYQTRHKIDVPFFKDELETFQAKFLLTLNPEGKKDHIPNCFAVISSGGESSN